MAFKTGYIKSPGDCRDFIYGQVLGMDTVFKASLPYRFSRLDTCGAVRNQGSFGTCVAFAGGGVKDEQEARNYPGRGIITSPLFLYKKCKELDGIPTTEGTYPRVLMKVLQQYGVCKESSFPYSGMTWPSMPSIPTKAVDEATQFKIGAYASISTLTEVKHSLINNGPVLVALLLYESFLYPTNGFIPLPGENGRDSLLGGHGMVVVAYDDDMTNGKHKGYFTLRNSWGASWGDGGYCYVPYDYFTARDSIGMAFWQESWSSVDVIVPPKQAKKITLWVDKTRAVVDGEEMVLDQAPTVNPQTQRTLVPVRFIAEQLGYKVEWNGVEKRIDISTY